VTDPQDKVVVGAEVRIFNQATGVERKITTNGDGLYTAPFVSPGSYQIYVQAAGFSTVSSEPLTVTVGQVLVFDVQLKVGNAQQQVTVNAGALTINTTDGSVSTVIDQKFVEDMPLNGRSFQSLILLTPGTLTDSPQRTSGSNFGELSVNGQRTESNYYTVDGVSAMGGISSAATGAGTSGSLSASTALGTTQALVSVDALQEFRVEGSTYSAEYGRTPGGQFSMVTRSGTNDWHGTTFDYFRNEALDANSWFNDNTVPITRKPPERQNDFGGTLGGPIHIPHLYNGTNRTFFFFSYEGLRLNQPSAATINGVPSNAFRQSVTGPLQEVLAAFPLPTPNQPDLGGGLSAFIASWSDPSRVDATSVRIDHTIGQRLHLFFRFSDTPSNTARRGTPASDSSPSTNTVTSSLSRTNTLGITTHIATHVDNELRLNYSSNNVQNSSVSDSFGGATPLDLNQLTGLTSGAQTEVGLFFGAYNTSLYTSSSTASQRQWNLVDSMTFELGKHSFKAGVDWRRLTPVLRQANPYVDYEFDSEPAVTGNSVDYGYAFAYVPNYPLYTNFSAFAQDEWRAAQRLTFSLGLRWDVNPAPGVTRGLPPYTITGLENYSTMTLAPQGTPLWETTWFNLAPRLGVAYMPNSKPGRETVIRGGGGLFFDTGQQTGSYGFTGPGFSARNLYGTGYGVSTSFPVPLSVSNPTIAEPPSPPYGTVIANPTHLQLPYTLQWNVSVEQAMGRSQSFTISYVGANGRKLLELANINAAKYNPNFTTVYINKNGLTSTYNSLQAKFQRQIARGLQALGSYTWSHSLDYGSYNAVYPYQYGNSDFDVRSNATGALSYDLPQLQSAPHWFHTIAAGWSVDARFTARTGFPVFLNGNTTVDPTTQQTYYGGLNLVPNVPLLLYGSRSLYPGGRRINPAAFTRPAKGQAGNASRNFIRGFGASQADIALRRVFPIHDVLQGQLKMEAFNVLNHPNFGSINTTYGNVQFGEATQILAQSLGTLSPIYQQGGPRSLQLSLKLTF
jgi:hypothetical protein